MKKIYFIVVVALTIFSGCGGSEDTPPKAKLYEADVRSSCTGTNPSVYCISEAESTRLSNIPSGSGPCVYVTIRTLDNRSIGGYLRSHGTSYSSCQ